MPKQQQNKGTVFTTGANGMLGSNIVRELLHQGYTVKAMVRKSSNLTTIKELPDLKIVYGDLNDPEKIQELMKGCEYVIHIAALAASWPSRSQKYFEVNVKGTEHMIEAALAQKVKRFIHISSSNTQGFTGSKIKPGDEQSPWAGDQGMDYLLTKRLAHLMVEKAVKEKNLPALLICPTFMIGSYDTGPSSGQLLVRAWNKPPAFLTGGGKNFVAARDVAIATVHALSMGKIGESYICGHENLKFGEFFKQIEEQTGIPQATFTVPKFLVIMMGWMMDFGSKVFGSKPLLTVAMAKTACMEMYYSPKKAIQELKMPQTEIREAIQEAYHWFGTHKYLKDYEKK